MAQDPKADAKADPKAYPGADPIDPQANQRKPSFKEQMSEFGKKAKVAAAQAKVELDARLTMQGQLKAARESLEKFLSPKLDVEKQIPVELMRGAKGIVFLSSLKASFGFGASIGSGVIISKIDLGSGWSGPCSIGLLGGQWGFNMGAQKTDFIIILRDDNSVKLFSGKGQIKFGGDASIAAGPHGRDAQLAVGANSKGYAATVSYSLAKGLYIGVALEGQGISVRKDCNQKFYGEKLEVKDILSNASSVQNQDYEQICALLTSYIANTQNNDSQVQDNEQEEEEGKQPL